MLGKFWRAFHRKLAVFVQVVPSCCCRCVLVRIELKLRRFGKPTFMVLKFGACCKYLTSIHEYLISSNKPVFIGLNYRCRLHLKLKGLLYSQKYSHWIRVLLYCCLVLATSMGTTIEQLSIKDRLSQQFWQSQDVKDGRDFTSTGQGDEYHHPFLRGIPPGKHKLSSKWIL